MTVAEKLITIADNTPLVANAVNAARTTASGSVIRVDDVLASEHPVKVQLRSKNFLSALTKYPTRVKNAQPIHLKAGHKYTLSFDGEYPEWRFILCGTDINGNPFTPFAGNGSSVGNAEFIKSAYAISWAYPGFTAIYASSNRTGNADTLECVKDCLITDIQIYVIGTEVTPFTKFQLEEGAVATAITPYVDDFSGLSTTVQGKNLLSAMSKWSALPQENAQPIFMKAGQKYTFSHNGEYTAWRLMFYGTEADGSALPIDPDITASQLSGVYIDSTYATNSGNRPRIQYAANLTGSHHVIRCKKDFTVTAIQLWVTGEEITPCTQFQLELGAAATAYTPYEPAQIAEADETGKVRGLQSMSPTMTLTAADPAVTVECEYFPQTASDIYSKAQEIKTALTELKEALL